MPPVASTSKGQQMYNNKATRSGPSCGSASEDFTPGLMETMAAPKGKGRALSTSTQENEEGHRSTKQGYGHRGHVAKKRRTDRGSSVSEYDECSEQGQGDDYDGGDEDDLTVGGAKRPGSQQQPPTARQFPSDGYSVGKTPGAILDEQNKITQPGGLDLALRRQSKSSGVKMQCGNYHGGCGNGQGTRWLSPGEVYVGGWVTPGRPAAGTHVGSCLIDVTPLQWIRTTHSLRHSDLPLMLKEVNADKDQVVTLTLGARVLDIYLMHYKEGSDVFKRVTTLGSAVSKIGENTNSALPLDPRLRFFSPLEFGNLLTSNNDLVRARKRPSWWAPPLLPFSAVKWPTAVLEHADLRPIFEFLSDCEIFKKDFAIVVDDWEGQSGEIKIIPVIGGDAGRALEEKRQKEGGIAAPVFDEDDDDDGLAGGEGKKRKATSQDQRKKKDKKMLSDDKLASFQTLLDRKKYPDAQALEALGKIKLLEGIDSLGLRVKGGRDKASVDAFAVSLFNGLGKKEKIALINAAAARVAEGVVEAGGDVEIADDDEE